MFVILDDLQAADTPSVRLLEFLAPQLRSMPAVVLTTCREEDAGAVRASLNALRPHAHTLRISGLNANGIEALVAELTGSTPTLSTTEAVRRHAGGNPLFARELVRFLADEGGSLSILQRSGVLPSVPDSVRGDWPAG